MSTPIRELAEKVYQLERPFVMDTTQPERLLGFGPTPIEQAARETVAWRRIQTTA